MQMEGIEPLDRYSHLSSGYTSRRTGSRRCSPRLPTPEASRSSNGSLDEQITREYTHSGAPVHAMSSGYSPSRESMSIDAGIHKTRFRRDSLHYGAPQSPPYQPTDQQKPSLPPLKTILGDTMSSPPDTPRTHEMPFQPSPREPTFTTSTFKPAAFYPSKKPRTELVFASSPKFDSRSRLTSPTRTSASNDSRNGYHNDRPIVAGSQPPSRPEVDGSKSFSSYQGFTPRQYQGSYQYSGAIIEATNKPTEQAPYNSPKRTIAPPALDPPFARSAAQHERPPVDLQPPHRNGNHAYSMEQSMSRRSSMQSHGEYVPPPKFELRRPSYHHLSTPQCSLPLRDDYMPSTDSHPFSRHRQTVDMTAYNGRGYADPQPSAFFMPSHYECQQGKTRKRSNLPKQSTEIMKTWFDQNITNPYPSEEQKAIFSNATGISMTQVSNWFINHRRRCPELRDNKKDKARTGGADGGE